METERRKWKAREERLIRQVDEATLKRRPEKAAGGERTEGGLASGQGSLPRGATPSRTVPCYDDGAETSSERRSQPHPAS